MSIVTRGRGIFAAILIVVLAVGLVNTIGWTQAQDATPDIDTLDEICATLEASPNASPETSPASPEASPAIGDVGTIGTPEADTTGSDLAIAASPAAELEAELCGTPVT